MLYIHNTLDNTGYQDIQCSTGDNHTLCYTGWDTSYNIYTIHQIQVANIQFNLVYDLVVQSRTTIHGLFDENLGNVNFFQTKCQPIY